MLDLWWCCYLIEVSCGWLLILLTCQYRGFNWPNCSVIFWTMANSCWYPSLWCDIISGCWYLPLFWGGRLNCCPSFSGMHFQLLLFIIDLYVSTNVYNIFKCSRLLACTVGCYAINKNLSFKFFLEVGVGLWWVGMGESLVGGGFGSRCKMHIKYML